MKHTVYGISLAAIALLVVAIALGISGKNVRANEMETSLNAAIEQSMEQLRIGKGSGEGNSQDMVADFNPHIQYAAFCICSKDFHLDI